MTKRLTEQVPDEHVLGNLAREQLLGRGHAGAFVGLAPDQPRESRTLQPRVRLSAYGVTAVTGHV